MAVRRRMTALLYGIALSVFALDRLSKLWVEHTLVHRPPIRVIPGVLSLTYTTNSGGAFGIGRSAPWLFVGATVAVGAAIVIASLRPMRPSVAVALGLILGGAAGNLTDRIVNGPALRGEVTDFIDFHVWPVFNLADTAIVIGAILLAIVSFGDDREDRDAENGMPAGADEPA
jgi:signal peptidase II